jgi:hypothetical protein
MRTSCRGGGLCFALYLLRWPNFQKAVRVKTLTLLLSDGPCLIGVQYTTSAVQPAATFMTGVRCTVPYTYDKKERHAE